MNLLLSVRLLSHLSAVVLQTIYLLTLWIVLGTSQCCSVCWPIFTSLRKKEKGRYSSSWGDPTLELRDVTCHRGSHSVTCHPTQVNVPCLTHAGWYLIYLPLRDGRLGWLGWLDSNPARSQTSDLSITSSMPNHCTTKTAISFVCELHNHTMMWIVGDSRGITTGRTTPDRRTYQLSPSGWLDLTLPCLF